MLRVCDRGAAILMLHMDTICVEKTGVTAKNFDIVAIIKAAPHPDLLINHRLSTATQVTKANFQIDAQLAKHGGRVDVHESINGRAE